MCCWGVINKAHALQPCSSNGQGSMWRWAKMLLHVSYILWEFLHGATVQYF